jgi:spermidine synthase
MLSDPAALPWRARTAAGWLLPTLALLFFFSGLSGLIYQVLWLRLVGLVFGVTVWAASTVLASFMAGLALGSLVAGRLVDRVRNPLLWYGVAEILVGLSALATPAALDGVEGLYTELFSALPHALVPLTFLRFSLAFIVLAVPTTLMGATLPIIVKSSLLRTEGLGERIGLLYATNTAGAVAGTLLAGLYLIGGVGITASFQWAAFINVIVGIVAIVAAFPERAPSANSAGPRAAHTPATDDFPEVAIPASARWVVLLVFALSGFVALALEVIWFRVLVLFLHVSTYAFTTMLATVLCGIAVGSYVAMPLVRRRLDWLALLAVLELATGVAALLSFTLLGFTYAIVSAESLVGSSLLRQTLQMLVASFVAIFPTMLLMGIAFPIGLRLWAASGADASRHTGERIGLFYSLNVFGAILGSVAAGFLLLPPLGSQSSLIAVAAISLVSGLLLLTRLPRTRRAFAFSAGGVGVLLFLLAAASVPNPFAMVLAHRYSGAHLLWWEEGVQATVTVHQQPSGTRVLYIDGLHQAEDSLSQVHLHRQIGHLPMALHHNPTDALVIGLGGGVTPGAVSQHSGVQVDVVELSETVVRGAEWFNHVNNNVTQHPNVHLRIDDGRNYLLLTPKRYDVITADVIQPTTAGSGNLYSAEYFQLVRNVLRDDGLVLQWIGIRPETTYQLIMRTFLSVFPNTTLWANGQLMVGTKQPLGLDSLAFERKLQDPLTREALESIGVLSFEMLLALYTAGPEELQQLVGPGPILTDDRPRVEYFLSLPRSEPIIDLSHMRGDVLRHVRQ